MKKLSKIFGTILLSAALILSLAACGSSTDTKESGKTGDEPAKQQESVTENPVKEDAKEDSQKPSEAGTEEQVTDDTAAGSGLSGFDSKPSWSFALFMRVLPVFSARPFFSLLAKFGEWRQNGVKKFKSHA